MKMTAPPPESSRTDPTYQTLLARMDRLLADAEGARDTAAIEAIGTELEIVFAAIDDRAEVLRGREQRQAPASARDWRPSALRARLDRLAAREPVTRQVAHQHQVDPDRRGARWQRHDIAAELGRRTLDERQHQTAALLEGAPLRGFA